MNTYDHNDITAISHTLQDYFDGLYDGDLPKFERVFHPAAHLYSTDGVTVTDLPRADYFDMIAGRPSPAAQSLARHDRIPCELDGVPVDVQEVGTLRADQQGGTDVT